MMSARGSHLPIWAIVSEASGTSSEVDLDYIEIINENDTVEMVMNAA